MQIRGMVNNAEFVGSSVDDLIRFIDESGGLDSVSVGVVRDNRTLFSLSHYDGETSVNFAYMVYGTADGRKQARDKGTSIRKMADNTEEFAEQMLFYIENCEKLRMIGMDTGE